jgi:hypothetical protein
MITGTVGITGGYYYYPQPYVPNVCPGCGRCKDCGQPNIPQPTVGPYWGWNQPFYYVHQVTY